ncbi:NAD(P)H-dependent D-xylose reductase (XR) [Lambiella insularis]|nr:NAD(P)H-dependent D-xylose reductase (XR) [Lambiella insularis]
MASPAVKLNSGHEMPLVGFGLWKVNNDTCADTVYNAIKTGYRLFDGACGKFAPTLSSVLPKLTGADYGNEVEAGQGVARAIKEKVVTRDELFIVSKLWNSFHDRDRVEPICKKQLKDWGIDHFDLYIVHFPISLKYVDPSERYPPGFTYDGKNVVPGKATIQETWTAMESLVEKGLTKSIGISNFNGQLIMDLLRYAKITPATLQIEHHPYLTQEGLVKLAQENGMRVTAYSSFGPQSFLELEMQRAKDTALLFDNQTVKSIASKHDKTPAQVLLRWATQRNIAVIPKSNNQSRLQQNLDVTSFELSKGELDEISGLNRSLRFNDPLNVSEL